MFIARLRRRLALPTFNNEEDRRVARILTDCVLALLAACPVFIVISALRLDWIVVALTAALMGALAGVWLLIQRRQVYLASLVITGAVLLVVTLVVTAGQGIHDVTIVVYPAVITFASLLLRRRAFVAATLLTIASVGWTVFGAMAGWFVPQPHSVGSLADFIDVSLILAIVALLVYYLADNMRQALAQAQREIAERKEAEARLSASEGRFRALVENSWDSLSLVSASGSVTYISPSQERLLGYPDKTRLGNGAFENVHPDDRDRASQLFAQLLKAPGQVVTAELRLQPSDGRLMWAEILAQNLLHLPEVSAVVVHARDITERRQADEQLRQRLAAMEAVAHVSTALRAARGLDEMLPMLLDEILASLKADTGCIALSQPGGHGWLPSVGRGWFGHLEITPMQVGEGVAGHVISLGQVYRIPDFASDPYLVASTRPHVPAGWSGVGAPIRRAQEVIGAITVAVAAPRVLDEDEVRLLTTLAELAGNAIHRAQLHEETERNLQRQAALRLVDQAITSSTDATATLNTLLEQAAAHLGADAAAVLRLSGQTHRLEFVAGHGFRTPLAAEVDLHPGAGYAGRVRPENEDVSHSHWDRPGAGVPATVTTGRLSLAGAEGFAAYHTVPLIAKGQVQGVLEVFYRQPFQPSADWLNFLEALAGQAAIAIDNSELWEELQRSNAELTEAYDATIEGWARALDLRERETGHHARRVTEYTLRLAQAMGLKGEALVPIRRGALLHDIGKMGVPDSILLKPGPLTPDEWSVMRKHPQYAFNMLSAISYLRPALEIPYSHHEKWDGTGYPRGLIGDQIPYAARLFAVADVWDALRSDRPYRPAWPVEKTRAYLREQAGQHFDPQLVDVFLCLIDEQKGAAS